MTRETMVRHGARSRRRGTRAANPAATLAVAVALAGCNMLDDLVNVQAPSRIEADDLETPANAAGLLDGAIGDFECAFGQYVLFQGVMSDELQFAQGSESWRAIDARDIVTSGFEAAYALGTCSSPHQGQVPGVYKPLSTARFQADNLLSLLDTWPANQVGNRDHLRATAAAYSGYSHLLLGESMCTAAFDLGPELSQGQILEHAANRFTAAIALAETLGLDEILHMARVGRARTRLNQGDMPGAKADAERVPAGFVKTAEFSTVSTRRHNPLQQRNNRSNNVTVEPGYRDTGDPRIPVLDGNRLSSNGIPIWYQQKYDALNAAIPLARWEEAQLIIAEAELASGNLGAAVEAINRVRTRPGVGLPAFASGDASEIQAQIIAERAAELFLESHRLGDIRRYSLPLIPAPGAVYPLGGVYGGDRCLPLPDVERDNNPNIGRR